MFFFVHGLFDICNLFAEVVSVVMSKMPDVVVNERLAPVGHSHTVGVLHFLSCDVNKIASIPDLYQF